MEGMDIGDITYSLLVRKGYEDKKISDDFF